jgi:riboflavin synthase
MKDLQSIKGVLVGLSYEEKIEISEFLHTEIENCIGNAVKDKAKKVSGQVDNFLDKAEKITKSAGQSLRDSFNQATDQNA